MRPDLPCFWWFLVLFCCLAHAKKPEEEDAVSKLSKTCRKLKVQVHIDSCISCVNALSLPLSRKQLRNAKWKCIPWADEIKYLLGRSCSKGNETIKNIEIPLTCQACLEYYILEDHPQVDEINKMRAMCLTNQKDPKQQLTMQCQNRTENDAEKERCMTCVEKSNLTRESSQEVIKEIRWKCLLMMKWIKKTRGLCEKRFRSFEKTQTDCENCVDKYTSMDLGISVRLITRDCFRHNPHPKEVAKARCFKIFEKNPQDLESCKNCVDKYEDSEITGRKAKEMYKECFPKADARTRALEKCSQKYNNTEHIDDCKKCVETYVKDKNLSQVTGRQLARHCLRKIRDANVFLSEACQKMNNNSEEKKKSCIKCMQENEPPINATQKQIRKIKQKCLQVDHKTMFKSKCKEIMKTKEDITYCQQCIDDYSFNQTPNKDDIKTIESICLSPPTVLSNSHEA